MKPQQINHEDADQKPKNDGVESRIYDEDCYDPFELQEDIDKAADEEN